MLYSEVPIVVPSEQAVLAQHESASSATQAAFDYRRARWGRLEFGTLSARAAGRRETLKASNEHLLRSEQLLGSKSSCATQQYLSAWRLALHNSDCAIDAADATQYQRIRFTLDGGTYPMVSMQLPPGQTRRSIADNASDRCACRLCTYIQETGARDCSNSSIMAQLDNYLLLVNKFPANIGDSLLLPIAHDNGAQRCLLHRGSNDRIYIPPTPGKTREALLSVEYLLTVMAVCNRFSLNARRNHLLDGKSEPHDHFKLAPSSCPQDCLASIVEEIEFKNAQQESETLVRYLLPESTPFETLAVYGDHPLALAQAVASLTQSLEREHEVFTLLFQQGCWLITPRRRELLADYCEYPALGASLGAHGLPNPETDPQLFARACELVPLKGDGYWQSRVPLTEAMPLVAQAA